MGQAGGGVGGCMAGQFVAGLMESAEALAEVLGAGHKVGALQDKTTPVLKHPQALPGPIEIGVNQPVDGRRLPGLMGEQAGINHGGDANNGDNRFNV
jgi:hypothetical protein